jgi:type IV pilus assembly protein PilA
MLAKLNRRMKSDEGFTLIELLIVLIIIAILVAIAIPSYLGFRDRANERAAQANVRAAVPSAEAFFSDNNHYNFGAPSGTNTTPDTLIAIDSGIYRQLAVFGTAAAATPQSYCISATIGNRTAKIVGPGGTVTSGPTSTTALNPAAACTTVAG